jgi:predicted transcriptional regulator
MRLGDSEFELLKHIQDNGPVSVKRVAVEYGEPKGLARTTVQTMMERLRKKGFLSRESGEGGYLYAARVAKETTLQDSIETFVKTTLGGSIAPIAAYFANAKHLSSEEIELLRGVIDELDSPSKGEGKS